MSSVPFATISSMHAAIASLLQLPGQQVQERIGGLLVVTSEQIEASWRPRGVKSSLRLLQALQPASLAEAQRRVAQAFHDPASGTTVYVADRIAAGAERGVILHETVHRYGRSVLAEGTWQRLVAGVRAWALWEPRTRERAIHDRAAQRAAGEAAAHADEELVAYAVEEAVAQGVRPGAEGLEGGAEQWLAAVVASLRQVGEKLLGNDLDDLTPQDLVDLAYALAQLDVPERAQQLRAEVERLGGSIELPAPAAPWFSALQREIEAMPEAALPAAGWTGAVRAAINRGTVKAAEVEWSGFEDWLQLQQGKVSKESVLDYLRDNGVQVEEVMKVDPREFDSARSRAQMHRDDLNVRITALGYDFKVRHGDPSEPVVIHRATGDEFVWDGHGFEKEDDFGAALPREVEEVATQLQKVQEELDGIKEHVSSANNTRYAKYTMPGGTNYRELVLKLPMPKKDLSVYDKDINVERKDTGRFDFKATYTTPGGKFLWGVGDTPEEAIQGVKAQLGLFQFTEPKATYTSSHWHEKNVIAHARFTDRTDAAGKRLLFVEELQSDWAQEGRRSGGFGRKELTVVEGPRRNHQDRVVYDFQEEDGSRYTGCGDTEDAAREDVYRHIDSLTRVAPAPFVESTDAWTALVVKRLIHLAAAEGYDGVAFVSGQQSADRYKLSHEVDEIIVMKLEDDQVTLWADRPDSESLNGRAVMLRETFAAKKLTDYIGAQLAARALADLANKPVGEMVEFKGLDLKVGGTGMIAFYDKIVPAMLTKLLPRIGGGELKQFAFPIKDASRGPVEPGSADANRLLDQIRERSGPLARHQVGFDVTPAMRAIALGGLPLFSAPSEDSAEPAP